MKALLLSLLMAAPLVAQVPATAPRTFVLAGQNDAFRDYCTTGPGKAFFTQLKTEFDEKWLNTPPPAEPQEYGDPDPKKRTSDKVDKWRGGQVAASQISGMAEAATIIWMVTGDPVYLKKAKDTLLAACRWSTGDPGATRITYNDEAHFRLWRKLPVVFDHLRDQLTPEEKKEVLDSFRQRGNDSFTLIQSKTKNAKRSSTEDDASSHPIRFISMTGIAGLALYDDLPEAKEWFQYALAFYKNQFPPWGGDDGGWGEGNAYWRGNLEHARFQDALCALGDPAAYANPFWKQTGYFALYFVQPYKHTAFGDTPVAGKFNLEPIVEDLETSLARHFGDGYLVSYAALADKSARSLASQGLYIADERYPAGFEYILRDFATRKEALPAAKPLTDLPPGRWFKDVGWVAMHSDLGKPDDDIMLSFKSSPYASFSHSHADQNAFILNAYGENLLINAGYREYHHSAHHEGYTEQTVSKNDLLIDGQGQKPRSKEAKGTVLGFEITDRLIWTAGDAAVAYNDNLDKPNIDEARRDVVMVDRRYFVTRDHVRLQVPKPVSLLLHAESKFQWNDATAEGSIQQPKAGCAIALVTPGKPWTVTQTDQFTVPIDPKYLAASPNQWHLTATSPEPAADQLVYTVLWPWRGQATDVKLSAKLNAAGALVIQRPDGKTDTLNFAKGQPSIQ